MAGLGPIDLTAWIEEHRDLLKPPVGNVRVFDEQGFIVMVVGGPNARKDFHVEDGPELFYQLEGSIVLTTIEDGVRRDVTIEPGHMLLLPPRVPHLPQRPAGTVGLVVERTRLPHERDVFLWRCDACEHELHRVSLHLTDITRELAPLFDAFWADEAKRTCSQCGSVLEPPASAPAPVPAPE